jgi:hypothetical protein
MKRQLMLAALALMMSSGAAFAKGPKCGEDQFLHGGKCYDSLGDIPGRTRGEQPSGAAHAKECTSMCHLFDAYALAQVCPNFTLNEQYRVDVRDLSEPLPGFSLTQQQRDIAGFKASAMGGVLNRIANAVNVCSPSCLKPENAEGTACQYLKSRPTITDEE